MSKPNDQCCTLQKRAGAEARGGGGGVNKNMLGWFFVFCLFCCLVFLFGGGGGVGGGGGGGGVSVNRYVAAPVFIRHMRWRLRPKAVMVAGGDAADD